MEGTHLQKIPEKIPEQDIHTFSAMSSGSIVVAAKGIKEILIIPKLVDDENEFDELPQQKKVTGFVIPEETLSMTVIGNQCSPICPHGNQWEFMAAYYVSHKLRIIGYDGNQLLEFSSIHCENIGNFSLLDRPPILLWTQLRHRLIIIFHTKETAATLQKSKGNPKSQKKLEKPNLERAAWYCSSYSIKCGHQELLHELEPQALYHDNDNQIRSQFIYQAAIISLNSARGEIPALMLFDNVDFNLKEYLLP